VILTTNVDEGLFFVWCEFIHLFLLPNQWRVIIELTAAIITHFGKVMVG